MLEDYDQVRELVHRVMAEAAEQTVAKAVHQTVDAVKEIISTKRQADAAGPEDNYASVKEVAQKLRLDRSSASRRIKDCIEQGLLETTEPMKKGRAIRLQLGEPLPDDKELLPDVEKIRALLKRKTRAA